MSEPTKKLMLALLLTLLAANSFAGQKISSKLTAAPGSAAGVYWQPQIINGKDFWLALEKDRWLALKGVSHEKFVRDSTYMYARVPIVKQNFQSLRTGILKEIELLDAKNKNHAPAVKFQFAPEEKSTILLYEKNLNDGTVKNFSVISGDHRNNKKRFRSVEGVLTTANSKALISKIRIHHGTGKFGFFEKFVITDRSGKKIPTRNTRNVRGVFFTELTKPVAADNIRIAFRTVPFKIIIKDFPPTLSKTLQKVPFVIQDFVRMNENNLIGLTAENFDAKSFNRFLKKYKNTFMGFGIAEFDSNYGQNRRPNNPSFYQIAGFTTRKDRNREDAEKYMHNLWNYQGNLLFSNVYSMSGGVMGSPYMAEWGSRNLILEYSCRTDRSARILSTFARSASRQYSVPWGFYMAYYAATGSPSSVRRRLDFGQPPSHGLRGMMMNYYMGENYQWFESQPWGMVVRKGKNNHLLTENGKAIKKFYDWITTPAGQRGSCYTPILLLLDYHHGHTGRPDWKVWYHLPMQDGDLMAKHIFDTISPLHPKARFTTPEHCINFANSPLGDIFDIFFANAPSGAITFEELGKYAAVVLADNIRFTPAVINNLKKYVAAGGTLVVNSGHLKGFATENKFLGIEPSGKFIPCNSMKLAAVKCTTAKVVRQSRDKKPLITLNRYGKGNVIFTTPYFMLNKNKRIRSALIGELLEKIQNEVLPFKISGDVHFIVNQMKDKSWKIILLNNRGVSKEPLASKEYIFSKYDSKVTVTVPSGASVKELYASAALNKKGNTCTLTVPAGNVRVLEIKNVKFGSAPISSKALTRKGSLQKWQDLCKGQDPVLPKIKKRVMASWDFSEGSGNVVKDSVSGAEIKLNKSVKFVKVKKGYALKFDGKKSCGQGIFKRLPNELGQITVEAWCKPDISPGSAWTIRGGKRAGFVVHHGTFSFALGVEGDKWQQLLSFDGYVTTAGIKVNSGKWTHLVFTWKDFTGRFYVDGVEVIPFFGTFKLSGVTKGIWMRVFLGTHYYNPGSGSSRSFNGLIGELKYYNYAMDEKEIRTRLEKNKVRYSD